MGYISRWKGRYIEQGLSGLSTRHEGRKASTQAVKLEAKILSHTQKQPMDGSTHWSTRKMAKALGIDHMTEVRTWQKHGIKPHLSQSYMHSDDPDFEAKAVDIIGLYPILLNMQSCLASMRRVPSRHWIERTPSSPCHQEEWKDMGLNITAMVRCRSIPPLILRMGQFMVKLPNGIPVRNSCLSFRGKTDSTTRTGNSYYLRQLVSPKKKKK